MMYNLVLLLIRFQYPREMADGIMMIFPKPIPWFDDVLEISSSKFIDKIEFKGLAEKETEQCLITGKLQGSVVWSATFGGRILHLSVESKLTVLYTTEQYLHLLRVETGQVAQLPLKIDRLAVLQHSGNHLLTINEFGWLQIFKLQPTTLLLKSDLKDLVLSHYHQKVGATEAAGFKRLQQGVHSAEGLSVMHIALKRSFSSGISETGEVRISLDSNTHLLFNHSLSAWHALPPDDPAELMYPTKNFTQWTEDLLVASRLATAGATSETHELLGHLEESIALSMLQQKVSLFTDLLTHYVLLLATQPHSARLVGFLRACISPGAPECAFLVQVCQIDPQTVVTNVTRLLQMHPGTAGLIAKLTCGLDPICQPKCK